MGSYPKHKKTIKGEFVERVSEHSRNWRLRRLLREHEIRYDFAKKFVADKIVADIACGNGYGTHFLAKSGAKFAYGIDYDKSAIAHATKYYGQKNIKFILGNAQNIRLNKESIDTIVSFETLEHLGDPGKFLKELKRILKPGGIFILSTPNREVSYEDNPYHIKEYTFSELDTLLSDFSQKNFYGQRHVYKHIVFLYKRIYKNISKLPVIAPLKFFLRFRPWENQKIVKVKNLSDTGYMYIIAVCKRR